MRAFIDRHGVQRPGRIAPIARELDLRRPGFDLADWVIKALGWVELTITPQYHRVRWRPSQLRPATAIAARRLILDINPLGQVELLRWTDRWHRDVTDGMGIAWALGESIGGNAELRGPSWRIERRGIADLYRDRQLAPIEDLSRVALRRIDRTSAAEIVEAAPSGIVGMVERSAAGRPFTYIRVGRKVRLFDSPEAFIGRDLRESSDPAFSAACVPSYELAAESDEPIIEDIEGRVVLASGVIGAVAYRRVLKRVARTPNGGAIIMKTAAILKPTMPVTA